MHTYSINSLTQNFANIGIVKGDTVLVHSSFKALGDVENGAQGFFEALFAAVGETGTVVFPTLSFTPVCQTLVFDQANTPSCVGYLSETFRKLPGVRRSIHPTHSCAAIGPETAYLLNGHENDRTPNGQNSPFTKLPLIGGKILMLGCGMAPMTTMHAVEETVGDMFLSEDTREYTLILADGTSVKQQHRGHDFVGKKIGQHYSRLEETLPAHAFQRGMVGAAPSFLIDAAELWKFGHKTMMQDPYFFVDCLG